MTDLRELKKKVISYLTIFMSMKSDVFRCIKSGWQPVANENARFTFCIMQPADFLSITATTVAIRANHKISYTR